MRPADRGEAGRVLTYAELESWSGRIAAQLAAAGAGPGTLVGILMERSIETVAAMLGVLRAGAAYVPLDPTFPRQRLEFLVADTQARVIITRDPLRDAATALGARVLVLSESGTETAPAPPPNNDAEAPAYVMYTSGSTGRPKGVVVPHRAIVRLVRGQSFATLDDSRVLLHLAPTAFDASTFEIWGALLNGGRCVVAPDGAMPDLTRLREVIAQNGVTTVWLTASLFNTIIDHAPATLETLSEVLTGGEALSEPHLRRAQELLPPVQFINGYGPTESTTFACCYRIPRPLPAHWRSIPIGPAIARTSVHVLDAALRTVPAGEPGDLYIGGDGLALGYLNRPELSAERFIASPSFGRLYKTGDRARVLEDGALDFLGRLDDQVKIRGHRVELGEIETELRAVAGVANAVVALREDSPGDRRLVAYYTLVDAITGPAPTALRNHLSARLPEHMVPSMFALLDAIPLTVNGKADRRALPAPGRRRPVLDKPALAPRDPLEQWIASLWREVLQLDEVGVQDRFFELGGTSIAAMRLLARMNEETSAPLPALLLFRGPTIADLAGILDREYRGVLPRAVTSGVTSAAVHASSQRSPQSQTRPRPRPASDERVAIIGMAGRFPGAQNIAELWVKLRDGVECSTEITAEDLRAAGVDPSALNDPSYVRRVFALEESEHFDAEFFGYTPAEAEMLDPQQRLLLETSWHALEHAGYDPDRYHGRVGVFAGVGRNSYYLHALSARPELLASAGEYHTLIGNERDFPTTHISYRLNLRGPSIDVQTACSTSGVAVHLACGSLRAGECDIALAGGSKVIIPNRQGYWYVEGGPLAPEGRVRAFDADANGMVRGSGAVMLVLKRLEEAIADGDTIHGVVLGSAVNNDGGAKIGFTAPSVDGQAAVIAEALQNAGVAADSIGYIETHGTGTVLGDPIEVAGLTKAFRQSTERTGFCRIGSVKTNIGHLDAAATAAGVVKTLLAFRHGVLPPSLNFTRPNPEIDFARSPFVVNATLTSWQNGDGPRRAGVSSFGLGGTNAHLVLQEPPALESAEHDGSPQLLVLSAQSEAALDAATTALATHLREHPKISLADAAWTLQAGRREMTHRRFAIASSAADAAAALSERDPRRVLTHVTGSAAPIQSWMFPGGGAQYAGMAAGLHAAEPVFRDAIAECAALLPAESRAALETMIASAVRSSDLSLERPSLALPALFAVEYALARLLGAWGLSPAAMIGHSMGEYTAACLAGVFSLADAVRVVLTRGRLFERLQPGAMVSVPLAEAELVPLLGDELSIAAINRPVSCVASGSVAAVDALVENLERRGIETTRIHIAVAAHSRLVEPILEEFGEVLAGITMHAPETPFVSNVTGTWITSDEARDPGYWVRHLRQTVRFADGVGTLLADTPRLLVEVGPGQTLSTFARQHPARTNHAVVSTVRHPHEAADDRDFLLNALGQLWLRGVALNWESVHSSRRRRIELPNYPFQRKRFSLAAGVPKPVPASPTPPVTQTPAEPAQTAAPGMPRRDRLVVELRRIVQELSGMDPARIDANATFLELGLDSLFLARANNAFKKRFNVRLTTRHLMEKTPTLNALATHLDRELAPDAFPEDRPATRAVASAPSAPAVALSTEAFAGASGSALEAVIVAQLQLMQAQLAALRGQGVSSAIASPGPTTAAASASAPTPVATPETTSPWQPVAKGRSASDLTAEQHAYVDRLIDRVTQRTPKSKAMTQSNRAQLSDPRTVQGFRKQWKEMVYPIVSDRAEGSHIWDVDGNEYIDLVNGYGVVFFGHSMPFILDAVREQLGRTLAIGPQTGLAGEVAKLVCELTGHERAAFCNTGSEAVLAAIRMARTVTGKTKLATFAGHYHGIFDEVLVKGMGTGAERRPVPIAPGIPANKVEDVVVLEYGNMASLDVIRRHADELAMVMVEPVRSRNLDLQPREFVQALRKLTEELRIPLLFDEMVTGFRSHPGGAQAIYGIKADIATYGKVVGGEFPIGVVAGRKEYLDALDGGMWAYGDDSTPEADMTWFAGTFVRHPLSLAAARAVLTRIKQEGPALQEGLNNRTTAFVRALNEHFRATSAPIHLEHFSSAFIITFTSFQEYSPLLFYELHTRGIYTYEGRPAFFTLSHSDADLARIASALKDSVAELRNVGLLSGGPVRKAGEVFQLPLAEGQQEIWLATRLGDDASRAFNLASTLRLRGALRIDALRDAVTQLVQRHESLRAIPNDDGMTQRVLPTLSIDVPLVDLADLEPEARDRRLAELREAEVETPFDLANGPLLRTRLVRLASDDHFFVLTTHHIVCDGWSSGVLLRELGAFYEAACTGRPANLRAPMQLTEFVRLSEENRSSQERAEAESYWLKEYSGAIPVLQLPADRPRPPRKTFRAKRITMPLDDAFVARTKQLASTSGATMFNTLLAGFGALLNRLTGQDDVVVGFSLAGQAAITDRDLVGHCVTFLPLRLAPAPAEKFSSFIDAVRAKVLDAVEYQNLAFGGLLKKLRMARDPSRVPLMSVAFNLDPSGRGLRFHDLVVETGSIPRRYENFDVFFNVVELGSDKLEIQCTFNLDLFDESTMWQRLSQYTALMDAAATARETPIGQLELG
ncbi:MAG: amino acid adenylation domain-containing protein, partial [Gemmatimonadaceae bacterium]